MSRSRSRLVIAWIGVVLATVAVAATAHAAEIGIVTSDSDDPFVRRLALELQHLGFQVSREVSVDSSPPAVVLEVSHGAVDLHETTADGSHRTRRLAAPATDALKVAEEVHALLLPLVAPSAAPVEPPKKPDRDVPPTATIRPKSDARLARPTERSTRIEVGAGAGALVGAASPGLGVTLSGALFPSGLQGAFTSFGVGVGGLVAAIPESVSSDAGSADMRAFILGAEAIGRTSFAPMAIDLAVGISVNHVRFQGNANAPFASRDEDATAISPTLRLRGTYGVGPLGVYLEGRSGIAIPQVSVRFVGESVGTWGLPWACFGGGLGWIVQ